ncbi:MAG: carboxymuconolactone decarboxylase family protein [Reichenbachiella sp.]
MERIGFQEVPKGYYDPIFKMGSIIKSSGLEVKLLELVRFRVAQINGCAYCLDMHYKELRHAGETELRASSLTAWEETPYFSELEIAVLKYTEALTLIAENKISDKLFNDLKTHFSQDEITGLTMAIVEINNWTRFMIAFNITPGQYEIGMFS